MTASENPTCRPVLTAEPTKRSQRYSLAALLIVSSILWISGNGLIPLLPLYGESLGASNAEIGLYLALSYGCLAAGGLVTSRFVSRPAVAKWILVSAGLLTVPLTMLIGQVQTIVQLTGITAIIWLLGGSGFSAIHALYGKYAKPANRGKTMGMLAITSPLGSVVGGLISGPIVDKWGFETLFYILAMINLFWPLLITFISLPLNSNRSGSMVTESCQQRVPAKQQIRQLMIGSIVAYMAYFTLLLALSLTMKDAGYSATAIASIAIWGGLVAMPCSYGLSTLSDRFGRFPLWCLCQLSGLSGLVILLLADELWHYWLTAILIRFISAGGRGIASAWAIDLHHSSANQSSGSRTSNQEKVLAALSTTVWTGGIAGFLFYGVFSQWLGNDMTLLITGLFSVMAIFMVLPIHHHRGML